MLVGAHLRVAEGVAHGEGHAGDVHFGDGVAGEVLATALALDIDVAAFVEAQIGADAQVELVFQQRLRQACIDQVESAGPALQGVALGRGDGEQTQLEVPGECLLQTDHGVDRPTVVALCQCVAAQVGVVQTAVEEETGVLGQQVVHIAAQSCLVALDDIAVGVVEQVVAVVEAILRDGVVDEVVVQVQVDHQLGGEHVVDQRDVMVLLHVELRITVGQGDGVGLVDIRVQIGDTRAGDAHVIGEAEVAAHAEVVLQTGCGNEAPVVLLEVVAVAEVVGHILPGVLVAETSLDADLVEVAGIFAIACEDGALILVLRAGAGIIDILQVVLGIGGGVVELQLTAEAQGLSCAERHGVVELEDVVGGLIIVVRITVGQVDELGAGAEVVGHLRGGGTVVQLIGEAQRVGVLLVEEMLVIEAAAERGA